MNTPTRGLIDGRMGLAVILVAVLGFNPAIHADQLAAPLPDGVKAVWDVDRAYREATPARERISINGLWRWQPAEAGADRVPSGSWGYFKVPGCWPGITDYMQKDCQAVVPHPAWAATRLGGIAAAWYEREVTIPGGWQGRRIALTAEFVNSFAAVYVDGNRAGEIAFPGGDLDLSPVCRPGGKHLLSMLVVAMPLKAVMLSYIDTASARQVKGTVARRGLCGDLYLVSTPTEGRIDDVRVVTSVRETKVIVDAGLLGLAPDRRYSLRAKVVSEGREVTGFASRSFSAGDVVDGRITFASDWMPDRLWDLHTPGNRYALSLSLEDSNAGDRVLDTAFDVHFGFRELWIEGRDFYLNGSRIFLSAVPLDNAQVGAALASYAGARESLERLKAIGINFVYTHNYGCEPGSHLGFEEILRAADDVGILVALSQPHFSHYDWKAPDADRGNGYARHAAYYVRTAATTSALRRVTRRWFFTP
jgi:beta-galactosidase/beta-glucuronidase